jgi:uroporphyrinogen-III decarboxylase
MELASIDRREIERRRDRIRRAWARRRVDHTPIAFVLEDFHGRTLREACTDGAVQLAANRENIDRLLRLLPDDYLPVARLWPGYVTIATMFGLPVHWSDDPNQAPGVGSHPVAGPGDVEAILAAGPPDPRTSGLMPFILEWTARFAAALPDEVCIAGPDLGGPLNTAKDLFQTDLLFTALYDWPDLFARFLAFAADVQAACYRDVIAAAGGIDRLSCIDFDPVWAPESRKGFVSDDVCAGLSPQHFRQFSIPANNRIFRRWRGGRIHNCGPHPAAEHYLDHDPPIDGLNCSFRYTRGDLPRLGRAFAGRGLVELMFDNGESGDAIVAGFEEAAGALAPGVMAVPIVWLDARWTDSDIRQLHAELGRVAIRHAADIEWNKE